MDMRANTYSSGDEYTLAYLVRQAVKVGLVSLRGFFLAARAVAHTHATPIIILLIPILLTRQRALVWAGLGEIESDNTTRQRNCCVCVT
jgi:hypothetical protein